MHYLIVDDDMGFATDLAQVIAGDDRIVTCVASSLAAMNHITAFEVDTVICDYDLGPEEMSGVDLITGMQRNWPAKHYVILSGLGRDDVPPWASAYLKDQLPELMARLESRW